MKGRTRFFLISVLVAIASVGACSNNTDFLHHIVPAPKPPETSGTYKVKDIVGDSRVDVLWVIDNSGSMYDTQQEVIQNTQVFMDEFTKKGTVDWKMGLISTDHGEDPYIGFTPTTELNSSTINAVGVFQNAVSRLGTIGSASEMFYRPLIRALTNYPDFLRPHSVLAIIFVSDAPEQSYMPTKDVLDFLVQKRGNLSRVLGYGVIWPQEWCPDFSGDDVFSLAGSAYEEFFGALKGKLYPLCKLDFGKDLADMGKSIVKHIASPRITLTKRPRVSTIQVLYKDNELPGGMPSEGGYWIYDYDLNAILFHTLDFAPGDTEEVKIVYREDDGGKE